MTSPLSLTDPQARLLVELAAHASPALSLTVELRAALLAGATALEREARAKAYDKQGDEEP